MPEILSYHVFDGCEWLHENEHDWTAEFANSASFNDPKLASDIGEREAKDGWAIYVMACLASQ